MSIIILAFSSFRFFSPTLLLRRSEEGIKTRLLFTGGERERKERRREKEEEGKERRTEKEEKGK